MSYVLWSEVVARYKELAKDFDSTDAQAALIGGAESEIDARLASRYTVPFTPVPGIIKDLAIDMAYYRAFWRQKAEKPLQDFIERRLSMLACGSSTLVVSGTVIAQVTVLPWSDRTGFRSSFGPDDPINWSTSKTWQDDAKDERSND